MRVVVVGYGGEGNVGDDVLVASLADLASAALRESRMVVAWGGRSQWDPPDVETIGRGLAEVSAAVNDADALIIGPGGILHNARGFRNRHRNRGLTYYDAVTAGAAHRGVPIGAIGIGVGPLVGSAARRLTKRILDRCATISVRDDNSRQILSDLGIVNVGIVPDLAIRAAKHRRQPHPPGQTILGLCIRPWIDREETRRIGVAVAAAIDLLVDSGHVTSVVGLPLSSSPLEALDDRWPTSAALEAVADSIDTHMVEVTDLGALGQDFADLDVMVSMRLHGVILARNVGTPAVGIECDAKVRAATSAIGSEIVRLGADATTIAEVVRRVLDKGRVVPAVESHDTVVSQILSLRGTRPPRGVATSSARRQIESFLLAAGV